MAQLYGGRNKRRASASFLASRPFFSLFTDPGAQQFASPLGQLNASVLGALYGAGTPVASGSTALHQEISPGVYQSAYHRAGKMDPRQAKWDAMMGGPSQAAATGGINPAMVQQLLGSNVSIPGLSDSGISY